MSRQRLTSDGEFINKKYHDEKGREVVDSTPIQPTVEQQRRMELIEAQRRAMLASLAFTTPTHYPIVDETPEEGDDFEIEGDHTFETRWEEKPEGFIPSDMDLKEAQRIIETANKFIEKNMDKVAPKPDEAPQIAKEGEA